MLGVRAHPTSSLAGRAFYEFFKTLAFVAGVVIFGYRAYGVRNIPRRGSVLIIANHQSMLDPPLLGIAAPSRHVDFVARIGLFKSKLFGALIRGLNASPIKRDEPDTVAIRKTIEKLRRGGCVMIFPEGTRTPDGEIKPFKRGAAVLIRKAKCAVVPAAIEGAYERWPRGRSLPTLMGPRVRVSYGTPIPPERFDGMAPDAALALVEDCVRELQADLRERARESRRAATRSAPARS